MQELDLLISQLSSPLSKKWLIQQYQIVRELGRGAYGVVYMVRKKHRLYALKRVQKKKLLRQDKQYQAFIERELLRKCNHPGIVKLYNCHQDKNYLNFVIQLCPGGSLTRFIQENRHYIRQENRVFCVAQIVAMLEYLHSVGVAHRDLKPQNIVLTKDGHLKLIDFGTAEVSHCTILDQKFKNHIQNINKSANLKRETSTQTDQHGNKQQVDIRKRRSKFVGTAYYLPPELLQSNIFEAASDLWALGCIIYQIYYLQPPFKATYEYQIFEKIKNVQLNFPTNDSLTEDALSLIKKLLVKNPQDRIGSNFKPGLMFSDLKNHPYFKNVNFSTIFTQKIPQLLQQPCNQQQNKHKLLKIKQQIQSQHPSIFSDQSTIKYSGIIQKKVFTSYSPVYYILKDQFFLLNITLHQLCPQRIILTPIRQNIIAQKIQNDKFKIIQDQCQLIIKTSQTDQWVHILNTQYIQVNNCQ